MKKFSKNAVNVYQILGILIVLNIQHLEILMLFNNVDYSISIMILMFIFFTIAVLLIVIPFICSLKEK